MLSRFFRRLAPNAARPDSMAASRASTPIVEPAPSENQTDLSRLRAPRLTDSIYVQIQGAEHGPIDFDQLVRFLSRSPQQEQVYVWSEGMLLWTPIQHIPGFESLRFPRSEMGTANPEDFDDPVYLRENRRSNRERIPATARIRPLDSRPAYFGVCLDISVTGLQMRFERPSLWHRNQRVEIEIFPISISKLPLLRGEGRVAWSHLGTSRIGILFDSFQHDGWERVKARF